MSDRGIGILFALATACFWGVYGPALGNARTLRPIAEGGWSPFKPYVFIGLAYLVWGCLGGIAAMKAFGDSFSFSGTQKPAGVWGFIAGSLGAFGALTLTFAVMKTKSPALVMPIVFGGAVSVTAITSLVVLMLKHSAERPSPLLWIGMLLVAAGIVLVAQNTPHGGPGHKPAAKATVAATSDDATSAH
jgi:drug/metabolite transporter (DMT)-like permease